jgi:hypothetical protein
MSVVFKTTVNTPSRHVVDRKADTFVTLGPIYSGDAAAAAPIDEHILLDALGDAMGMIAAEQRMEREHEANALREKIATLEGKVDVLVRLMEGKSVIIDLPALPARMRHVA